jgi:hypothetical protein
MKKINQSTESTYMHTMPNVSSGSLTRYRQTADVGGCIFGELITKF